MVVVVDAEAVVAAVEEVVVSFVLFAKLTVFFLVFCSVSEWTK